MHFGRVEVGDRYSVSPEATLGPTPREWKEKSEQRVLGSYAASDQLASKKERCREFDSC
jgi:hypothetical protein